MKMSRKPNGGKDWKQRGWGVRILLGCRCFPRYDSFLSPFFPENHHQKCGAPPSCEDQSAISTLCCKLCTCLPCMTGSVRDLTFLLQLTWLLFTAIPEKILLVWFGAKKPSKRLQDLAVPIQKNSLHKLLAQFHSKKWMLQQGIGIRWWDHRAECRARGI